MQNWSIAKRVIAGFASVILLIVALGAFAGYELYTIQTASARITEDHLPSLEDISTVDTLVTTNLLLSYKHLGSTDDSDITEIEKDMAANSKLITDRLTHYTDISDDAETLQAIANIKKARAAYEAKLEEVLTMSRGRQDNQAAYNFARAELDPLAAAYAKVLKSVRDSETAQAAQSKQDITDTSRSARQGIIIGLGVTILLAIGVTTILVRGTNRVLGRVTGALEETSTQMTGAAGQVSSASQSLAEGSTEQAASLEETSASLEEMASMTAQNSTSATKANELARQAREVADVGARDMTAMSTAMGEIKRSSDEIAKIIKTIDEIAFQTNILALNAAVEAARAGDAGLGFAVVADEVRNLAQRAAQAARETADKIEGAVTKTAQGVELTDRVAGSLNQIIEKVREVDTLISEVATASREQADGVKQINGAVGQMDKVVQSNSSAAEETAAAAQELNSQAHALTDAVRTLRTLAQSDTAKKKKAKADKKKQGKSDAAAEAETETPAAATTATAKVHAPATATVGGKAPASAAAPAITMHTPHGGRAKETAIARRLATTPAPVLVRPAAGGSAKRNGKGNDLDSFFTES